MGATVGSKDFAFQQLEVMFTDSLSVGNNLQIHLFVNNFVPSNNTVLADVVEATYAWYAPQGPLAIPTAVIDTLQDDWALSDAPTYLVWNITGATAGDPIYGWYATSGSKLLLIERFAVPVILLDGDQYLTTNHKLFSAPVTGPDADET